MPSWLARSTLGSARMVRKNLLLLASPDPAADGVGFASPATAPGDTAATSVVRASLMVRATTTGEREPPAHTETEEEEWWSGAPELGEPAIFLRAAHAIIAPANYPSFRFQGWWRLFVLRPGPVPTGGASGRPTWAPPPSPLMRFWFTC